MSILLLVLFGLVILGVLGAFLGRGGGMRGIAHKRHYLEEIMLENNRSRNKVAVVSVEGMISSDDTDGRGRSMVEDIRDQFKAAADDKSVKAVLLKINSPGGEVLASDEIYHLIEDFQKTTRKPVIASMQTLAASGGYYVAVPCRWIVANEMTLTGSIGVILHGWNVAGLMNKIGVRTQTYKSGEYKDMLSPFRDPEDIPEGEKRMLLDLIEETYTKFTNVVVAGRSEAYRAHGRAGARPLDEAWEEYTDGRVFSGTQAYNLGFVDELGNFEAAFERALKLAGIQDANLIEYQQPFQFGDFFRLFGQAEQAKIKVDVGVEFPKLQPGCLYFLYHYAVP